VNLVLLEDSDFIDGNRVRLCDERRLLHIRKVHRAGVGDQLRVGRINGKVGTGHIEKSEDRALGLTVDLFKDPPAALPVRLILALPRPKVLNRTIAAAVSMGIREIDLINAWRVEKAYWQTPKLSEDNLRMQAIFGLEQSGDTILPTIRKHQLFVPFVREELPQRLSGGLALLAHPEGAAECPRNVNAPVVLAIGPEGGFIEREVGTFREIGFTPVSFGARILRVETALAFLIGRLL
jgi:RsmE family RNA methyltransferase